MTDKDYIKELKERDKERPLRKKYWAPGVKPLASCPNCGEIVYSTRGSFCEWCGQRLAKDVWEL